MGKEGASGKSGVAGKMEGLQMPRDAERLARDMPQSAGGIKTK